MSKAVRKLALATRRLHFSAAGIDGLAENYLRALEIADHVKKLLLRACRAQGFTPKDAPKTKMLAGELYEVLASRATRTVVDQNRARALREKLVARHSGGWLMCLLNTRLVFDIAEDAEQYMRNMPAWVRRRFAEIVQTHSAGTRLTVRKKKSQSSRVAKSQRRKVRSRDSGGVHRTPETGAA